MPTVYQRALYYSARIKRFYWPQRHRKMVGAEIKKDFTATYQDQPLDTVESKEFGGPYQVFNYPDHYTSRMDEIIAAYVARITAPKAKKISQPITEKPSPSPHKKIASSDPKKKQRKRIPVQKPAYSGNYKK